MKNQINDGGMINPRLSHSMNQRMANGDSISHFRWIEEGLTLRDHFAVAAMQGLLSIVWQPSVEGSGCREYDAGTDEKRYGLAHDAYLIADAMLLARQQKPEK